MATATQTDRKKDRQMCWMTYVFNSNTTMECPWNVQGMTMGWLLEWNPADIWSWPLCHGGPIVWAKPRQVKLLHGQPLVLSLISICYLAKHDMAGCLLLVISNLCSAIFPLHFVFFRQSYRKGETGEVIGWLNCIKLWHFTMQNANCQCFNIELYFYYTCII